MIPGSNIEMDSIENMIDPAMRNRLEELVAEGWVLKLHTETLKGDYRLCYRKETNADQFFAYLYIDNNSNNKKNSIVYFKNGTPTGVIENPILKSKIKNFRDFYKKESVNKDIWYHSSNQKFDTFKNVNNKMYQEIDLPVWFFTKDKEYASKFGKYLYQVELDINKTFDTSISSHMNLFLKELRESVKDKNKMNEILDEQFFNGLPYWTCEDAFYIANAFGFDSILIQEELSTEVLAVGIFDNTLINVLNIHD